jgi:heme/copper-type cytochrome/quinol oxidase subunit 3
MSSISAVDAAAVAAHDDHGHGALDTHGDTGHTTSTGVSNEKLSMWVFLGSECLLFGALIATYLVYKGRSIKPPFPHDTVFNGQKVKGIFDIPFTSVSSFVLLMSSLTMVLALSAIKRNDRRRGMVWLVTTAFLGSIFIAGQIYEFTSFIREGLTIKTNVFGSSFYVMTGFHGVHVTLGIVMLLGLANLVHRGKVGAHNAETIEIAGLYWHFVDVVWIVIFTVIYLIP